MTCIELVELVTDYLEGSMPADDVDAILNLTPFSLHVDVTLAALAAGKHVYSEKPLALTSAEAGVIAERADRSGCVVVAAPCVLLFPQLRRAREIVEGGELEHLPRPAVERQKRAARAGIRGELPSPKRPPAGCHFHPRCPKAMDVCSQQVPVFKEQSPGHWVMCHLYD